MPSNYFKVGLIIPSSNTMNVDCVFLSCTNWQAIDAIALLEARLSVPVISSNQATIDSVRKILSAFESRKTVSSRARASEQRQVV